MKNSAGFRKESGFFSEKGYIISVAVNENRNKKTEKNMGLDIKQFINNFQNNNQSNTGSSFSHTNEFLFKPNKTGKYRLRIIGLGSEVGRSSFFIGQYTHQHWGEDENGRRICDSVICPTSSYDEDRTGFKTCPICEKASELYNNYKTSQNQEFLDAYNTIKRKFTGYIPVYVVSAPAEHAEIKGKVMIMQYTIGLQKFLEQRIMGVTSSGSLSALVSADFDEEDDFKVGADAILTCNENTGEVNTLGYDLQIQVASKRMAFGGREVTMPEYNYAFYPRETEIEYLGEGIPANADGFHQIEKMVAPEFDRFYKKHKIEELNRFASTYLGDGEKKAEAVFEEVSKAVSEPTPQKKTSPPVKETKKDDLINTDDLFDGIEF